MIADSIPELKKLDASRKLLLASELWDAAMAEDLDIPASDALLDELEKRRAEYAENPAVVTSWNDAKARILGSRD